MPFSRRGVFVRIVFLASCIAMAGELAAQPKTPVPDAVAQQTAKKTAGDQGSARGGFRRRASRDRRCVVERGDRKSRRLRPPYSHVRRRSLGRRRGVMNQARVPVPVFLGPFILRWHRLDQSPQDLVHGFGRSEDFGHVGVQRDDQAGWVNSRCEPVRLRSAVVEPILGSQLVARAVCCLTIRCLLHSPFFRSSLLSGH